MSGLGFAVATTWDQGQGCGGLAEPLEAYNRFLMFLELGPDRTFTGLAKHLGVSQQAVSKMGLRFNWKKRANAYDASKGKKGKPARLAPEVPLEAPPPRPVEKHRPAGPTKPPSTASASASISPEVLVDEVLTDESLMTQGDAHLQALSHYRVAFDTLGSGMAREAQALLPLVQDFRSDLELARKVWRQLLEQQEIERANSMARTLWELIPAYYRICEAMHGLANGGRTHWGDAIGVQRILQEAFAVQKGKR